MQAIGYYNGEYGPLEEMKIPMLDRAVYYGDGVYEATPTRNGMIYALDAHIDRLYRSAAYLSITVPMDKQTLECELKRMVALMDTGDNVLYWQVSRGTARRAHPFPEGHANLMMMITPYTFPDLSEQVRCITREDTRFLHCNIKTLNLIPSVMAMQAARERGCYEAILHRNGRVTECSKSNVHILKDGCLISAPADNLILAGIARSHLFEVCGHLGIQVVERAYDVRELMEADEIFTTSSTSFIHRVTSVDGIAAGGRDSARFEALRDGVWGRFVKATDI